VIITFVLLGALMLIGIASFMRNPFDTERNKILDGYNRVLDQTTPEQEKEEFLKLPIDQQVDMFLLVMSTEIPRTRFDEMLASNGSKIVPSILARLRKDKDEYHRWSLIRVLKIVRWNYGRINQIPEVEETLKMVCSEIEDPQKRFECESYIRAIMN
jgi:hypothetical protein